MWPDTGHRGLWVPPPGLCGGPVGAQQGGHHGHPPPADGDPGRGGQHSLRTSFQRVTSTSRIAAPQSTAPKSPHGWLPPRGVGEAGPAPRSPSVCPSPSWAKRPPLLTLLLSGPMGYGKGHRPLSLHFRQSPSAQGAGTQTAQRKCPPDLRGGSRGSSRRVPSSLCFLARGVSLSPGLSRGHRLSVCRKPTACARTWPRCRRAGP